MKKQYLHFGNFKTPLKGEFQCENGKIKMFDSSLSKINIPMNEHLVYVKIMTSWSAERSLKIICCSSWLQWAFESSNFVILLSNVKIIAFWNKGVFHFILTTHLPLLTCALLLYVKNQFCPRWFVQRFYLLIYTSVTCAVGPSVNPLQNRETQHVNIVLQCMYRIFWTAKYERQSCLNWMVSLQVVSSSQLIFPFKTWFFGICLNLQWQKSLKNQYLPHSESKFYQINSIKSCSSRSVQQHQRHIPILWNFQLLFNLIFSEEIIQYSRTLLQVQT